MITAPSEAFLAALKASHERLTRATLFSLGANGALTEVGPVQIASGTLALDSTAAAWRRFSGEVVVPPETQAVIEAAQTFNGEIKIEAGVTLAGGAEWVQIAQLRVEEYSVTTDKASVSLTAFDRAQRVNDFPFITPYAPRDMNGYQLSAIDAIKDIVTTAFPSAAPPTFVVDPTLDASVTPPEETVFTGGRWDAISTLAQSIAAMVFNDNLGRFVIWSKRPDESVVDSVRSGHRGTMTQLQSSTTRVEQFNAVGLSCESPAQEPIFVYLVDDDPASPTYYDGPFGRKPYMTRNDSVTNVDDAIIAARGILNRRKTAARDVTLDAVYHPLLQPLDSVFLLEEGMGVQEAHTIESIDLPLVGGKMSMKTFRWLTGLVIWRELRANRTWDQVPPATTWRAATKVDVITPA